MKVGQIKIDKEGNTFEVIKELPKKDWIQEFSNNKSISKVFGVVVNGNTLAQAPFHKKTKAFDTYIKELKDSSFLKVMLEKCTIKDGSFDEMKAFGYETEDGRIRKSVHFTNSICEMHWDWEEETYFIHGQQLVKAQIDLCFTPWHDGVMLQSMIVNKESRNKGVGWAFFDEFVDNASMQTGIPLYLTPYPAENFNPKSEKRLVKRLNKFYDNWQYEPVENGFNNKVYTMPKD